MKLISWRWGKGATDIDRYLELDGYKAVRKALEMAPDAIINEVKISALRGRGGAGFSTGMKWSFVPKQSDKPKYILVNGDESEPGTCKDRLIVEYDPHSIIEGVIIAGLAVGAQLGFIYLRGEYRYLLDIMEKAVADAYARGFLARTSSAAARISRSSPILEQAHTRSAKSRRSWNRSKASGASPASASLSRGSRAVRRSHRYQQRRDAGLRSAHPDDGGREIRELRAGEKWRHAPILPSGHFATTAFMSCPWASP